MISKRKLPAYPESRFVSPSPGIDAFQLSLPLRYVETLWLKHPWKILKSPFLIYFVRPKGGAAAAMFSLSEAITVSQRQMGEMLLILRLLSGREVAITINQVPSVVAVVSETAAARSECVCVLYTIYLRSYIYIYLYIYIYEYIYNEPWLQGTQGDSPCQLVHDFWTTRSTGSDVIFLLGSVGRKVAKWLTTPIIYSICNSVTC